MDAARKYGTPISYDLNFRDSLWKSIGGKAKAQEVNRDIVRKVDVLLGNEEDFSAMLGIAIKGVGEDFAELPIAGYEEMLREVAAAYPNLKLVASTLRTAQPPAAMPGAPSLSTRTRSSTFRSATSTSSTAWAAATASPPASSTACSPAKASIGPSRCGVAHGALAMTTPGDTSMATLAEVERIIKGGSARIARSVMHPPECGFSLRLADSLTRFLLTRLFPRFFSCPKPHSKSSSESASFPFCAPRASPRAAPSSMP
jgi:2-dehydro-3-deoxygluconokinase